MPTETLAEIKVNMEGEFIRKIRAFFPDAKSDSEAIGAAVHKVLDERGHVTISQNALRELAARAGSRKPLRSEEDLIKAFECVTEIDRYSCVVHLESAEIPQIAASAAGQKIPIGEAIVQYLTHAIAQGWFSERVEVKHIMFRPEEWRNLASILGVPVVRSSDHLIKIILNLKTQIRDAREEVRAFKDAQEAIVESEGGLTIQTVEGELSI